MYPLSYSHSCYFRPCVLSYPLPTDAARGRNRLLPCQFLLHPYQSPRLDCCGRTTRTHQPLAGQSHSRSSDPDIPSTGRSVSFPIQCRYCISPLLPPKTRIFKVDILILQSFWGPNSHHKQISEHLNSGGPSPQTPLGV